MSKEKHPFIAIGQDQALDICSSPFVTSLEAQLRATVKEQCQIRI